MTASLSIIVVSYNTREMTLACLRSIFAEGSGEGVEVIVVDNGSSDGSANAIADEFGPRVRLITHAVNLGFAAANNEAARAARGRRLLLLNPDTVVLDRGVERLLEFAARNPESRIWGGRTVFADGSLNPASCWARPSPWSAACLVTGLSSAFRRSPLFNREGYGGWNRDSVREVDIVSGCFLLIDRDLWEQLGGFDPAFFMYGEDADLCMRARLFGARPMITPIATVVHHGGASERVRSDKMVRLLGAKVLLLRRHWRPLLVPLGIACLAAWPLTRACAWRAMAVVRRPGSDERARQWFEVWSRRREWVAGCS